MHKLNIITALSRPENLVVMADSITLAAAHFLVNWWIVGPELPADLPLVAASIELIRHPHSAGGQLQKNQAIERIPDGNEWVWILDDDNTAVPGFFERLKIEIARIPTARAVIFSQKSKEGHIRLTAAPQNVGPCNIDTAQFVLRRDLIGDDRIIDSYCGDGEFIGAIHRRASQVFTFVPDPPLVYYNSLR
jgi:hypothetical protein